jgi:hypothetical protein
LEPDAKPRVVKFFEPFNSKYKHLSGKIDRLDEFINISKITLSKKPELGKVTRNKCIYGLAMQSVDNNPLVTLYYFYTDEEVIIFNLKTGDGDGISDIVM